MDRKETACCQSSIFFNVKKKPSLSIRSISTVICTTKMHPSKQQQLCLVADASMKARKGYLHRVEQVTHSLPLLLRSLKWIIEKANQMLLLPGNIKLSRYLLESPNLPKKQWIFQLVSVFLMPMPCGQTLHCINTDRNILDDSY